MKKTLKRLCTGFLALATVVTALPTTLVHAESKQYWTESKERVGIVEKVMNDGSIGSTFNEGHLTVEGEDAYCIDINTDFKNGYKTRADASSRMSADQISDVALSIEYVKQYTDSHSGISKNHAYLLRQLVVWQRLSVHLGWQCDNVRASYDEIPKATQDEVFSGARAFVKENKGRYECGGYIYSGEGQELGQFWAKLNVGNAKLKKTSSNTSITDGNGNYSIAGATYGVFSDKDCTKQLATLTTDENGNTDVVEVKAGTVYIKELSAPAGYKVDKTVYSLKVEAGKTATLKVSDTPKVTDTLIEFFKIDMETQKDNPQGNASLAGAEFTWKYYAGFYNKDNLPAEATRTWVTKTIAETDSDGTTHYITKLADAYKVSGDSFYMQDGKAVLPLGTLTVEETKAPNGYLLDGAYMQAGDKSEQIKGLYVTQITEDGDLAVLSGSNQFSVSDKVIRGGVKIQKRDLETGDTKPQGSATLKDTAFDIISLNDNAVLVEGKLYKKNEVVKTIHTDIEGVASTSADLLPYGNFRIVESEAPDGYLTDGAKPIDFTITENGKIVDLTDEAHSIYNQIKRGDIEGVKIGAGTHKRLADVPFRITSKTTGENHVVVTDDNGQFSTSADWASHKHNTNAGKTSEDGVWFGTSEPDDSKGALPYDTYIIEELRSDSNKGFKLISPFEIVVSRNNLVIDLGTLTDEYEKEISIHTTATSKDGEKTILAGKEVTIVDTVKLDGLTKGTKYQLKGWQMLKEENAELLIDGKRVENDYTFVADDEEMKVKISYTFNASALGGKNLVTFEELYDLSNPDEPVKVAEHKDIEDDGQTVLITERIIKIHTTATDKDGNKELEAGKDVTIIDTVILEGLGDIFIYTSADEEKGVLLELKGRGCRQFESYLLAQQRSWYDFLMDALVDGGVMKRIDLAINDHTGILDIPELAEKCRKQEYIGKSRSYKFYQSGELIKHREDDREYMGRTLYLGSLKSDVYFCIYEKDYEQYVKLGTPLEEADIINRFEIRLRNERAYYAVRDLLTYYDAEQTAFSIINQYVRFVDEEPDKRKNDWKLNDRWAWFIGDNRQSLKLTTKPEPYTLDRTLRWVQRQVAPTLKMLKKIDKGNGTDYMETIEQQAKLTEKHEMIIKQQTTPAKDLVES